MATSPTVRELQERVARLERQAKRNMPVHARFADALAEALTGNDENIDVVLKAIRTQRGPLGGISTRVPMLWVDEGGEEHHIMVQIYADTNIERAFEEITL
jgi:hypothetical protein